MKIIGNGKRVLIFTLIVIIVLTMQGPRVFAESLQPEERSETSAEQQENQPETIEGQSVSQNDLAEEEQENQPETIEEESVSGNDLSELPPENQTAVAAEQTDATAFPELTDEILSKCILPGMNPPGVTVNLFDYWQDDNNERGEIAHDQEIGVLWRTYNIGISRGHLLRFGYRDAYCKYCQSDEGDFGEWNNSKTNELYTGIVKNKLGAYGFPVLNLNTIEDISKFGRYADSGNEEYLSKKEESLDYLFSPSVRLPDYKASYIDVQGLFQPSLDEDGYYFYNSTDNFASYNRATNSFILYNSPGVAEENGANEKSCGQFFPFNKAEEVFDTYTVDNGKYHLCYMNKDDSVSIKDNGYLQCSATRLNHYLGMTMEFLFQQPENGCLSNGNPMTFEFSGDDDVWIFIDGVLVADLGGLHNACSLDIDFSTGNVEVQGEQHTLLKSFKDAYGEDSDLGGIAFNENTFADNTVHTLKMFYLERGHAASDLDLKFNVQTIPYEPVTEESSNVPNKDTDENEDTNENEEPTLDPAQENMSEAEESIISVSDNHMVLDTTGIPRTGDDSMIGWLSALCIISLLGIGATACNLIIKKRKEDNHSSKQ